MAAVTDNQIAIINRQDQITSLPHRENYDVLKNAINNNQNQISNLATPPAGSEVTNARDYFDVLKDRVQANTNAIGHYIINGLEVTEQSTPNMTVLIGTGSAIVNSIGVYKDSTTSTGTIPAASASNYRYDIVVMNSDNTISVLTGNENTDQNKLSFPAVSSAQIPLAFFLITDSTSTITNSDINDLRKFNKTNSSTYFTGIDTDTFTNIVEIHDQRQFQHFFGSGEETGTGTTDGGWGYTVASSIVTTTIPTGTIVYLYPCESGGTTDTYNGNRGYLMKTCWQFSDNISVVGFNDEETIVVRDDDGGTYNSLIMKSTYTLQETVSSVSTNEFRGVAAYASYTEGDWLHTDEDNTFYRVTATSSANSGTVFVDRAITGSYGGTETISDMTKYVKLSGFSFDGYGGVGGLPGSLEVLNGIGAIAISADYLAFGDINIKLINHRGRLTTTSGSVLGSETNSGFNIKADKIHTCYTGTFGTAARGLYFSTLKAFTCEVRNNGMFYDCHDSSLYSYGSFSDDQNQACVADACTRCTIVADTCSNTTNDSDLFQNCDYCDIYAHNCFTSESICNTCTNCTIRAYNCNSTACDVGESCSYCTIYVYDGSRAALNCDNCIIFAYNCNRTSDNGAAASGCTYCYIYAYNCNITTSGSGGAAYNCDYCTIVAYNCSAATNGGGADNCDYCDITAYGCTATGSGDIAHTCANSKAIWGDSGTIISSTLGGVRLIANDVAGSGYTTTVAVTGSYTNATT